MEYKRITVCAYKKNAHKLKKPSYYARVKIDGKVKDIPLHTDSKDVAEAWVRLRRTEIQRYQDYVLAGETPPSDLLSKIMVVPRVASAKSVTVLKATDEWEAHLNRTGKSGATVSTYLRALRNCLDSSLTVAELSDKVLNDALRKHDGLKSATRKSYCVALREFTKFAVKEYGLNRELVDCFEFVHVRQEETPYWTMPQIRTLIDSLECRDKATTDCYKAWCWLMATTGCRQGESAKLEWNDVRGRYVTFRAENTKGNKTRTVPMPTGVAELINGLPRVNKYVFPYLASTQAGRYSVIAKAVKKTKIPHGGLHTFRKSCAMYLYAKISDLKLLGQLFGHSPAVSLLHYQKAREVEKVDDAISTAYEEENLLPSSMDSLMEEGFI